MKFSYKIIAPILGGIFLIGSTIAAALPSSFISGTNDDVVAVYGASAASSDMTAALDIGQVVADKIIENTPEPEAPTNGSDFSGSFGITEEVPLGGSIVSGKILATLTDNKIPTLIDGKLNWDDGESSDTSFNIHEEILIKDMNLLTSLDDNDFDDIALTNNKGLAYKLVFEEDLDTSRIGDDDADTLYIDILGKKYEIDAMDSDSITVVTSKEFTVKTGESITVEGVTLNIEAIAEDAIYVNGNVVDENRKEKVSGISVQVDSVFYRDSGDSLAIIRVGKDITSEFDSGDPYIGEDDDDPEWVWDIDNPGQKDGYIGITYDLKNTRAKDDVAYEGDSYEFPEQYATVIFDSLTDTDYWNYEISFIDDKDLWNSTETKSTAAKYDVPVLVIEGPEDDSLLALSSTTTNKETDTIYLRYASPTDGTEANSINGSIEVFYEDVNKDVSDSIRARYVDKYDLNATEDLSPTKIGEMVVDDTNVAIKVKVTNGNTELILDNSISDLIAKIDGSGYDLEFLGSIDEDSESDEVIVDGKSIGTEDNDVMDYYGMIIKTPDNNGDDDRILLEVPGDKIEAVISVKGQGEATKAESNETVILPTNADFIVKDSSIDSISDKNIIVVGGSCINAVARKLLGVTEPLCGEEFTAKTGVGSGKALVEVFKSPYNSEKVAVLVAGYEAADTTRAVNAVLDGTSGVDLVTVGSKAII